MSAGADIVWLRDDFRLEDQPAIVAVANRPALHVYIHDDSPRNGRPLGGAAEWRLARSLTAMEERLAACGARLDVMRGKADQVILALAASAKAARVLWTRRHEGAAIALDSAVKTLLRERGVEALSFNGRLLREPWEVAKPDGALSGSFSASNPMGWQWVAGSGADAAPYFRIFNPVLQAEKFDPDGAYVRRWVPGLARLGAPEIHAPWRASTEALARAGIVLGKTYPQPIVDHAFARARALDAFAAMRTR